MLVLPHFQLTVTEIVAMRVWALLLAGLCAGAQADPSRCYSIIDPDQKNHCLASVKGQKSYCYSVREADTRNLCLAQTSGQRSYCYSIRAQDARNYCLAMTK